MHSKKKDVLRQIQEGFCLIQFIVSSNPRSGGIGTETLRLCIIVIIIRGIVTSSLQTQMLVQLVPSTRL